METEQEDIKYLKGKTLEEGEWGDIVVIHPNGEYVLHDCEPSLENMQALVGGYVEVVPMFDKIYKRPCVVLVDEEGKLKGNPVNNRATLLWATVCPQLIDYESHDVQFRDMLVGDVVVLTGAAKKAWER